MLVLKKLWQHPGHLIWIVLAYLPRLGDMSMPLTGDQKTYIAIAQEMREKGEWLIPTLFGEPNFLKPPFQYWMTLIGWKVFGFGLWGALLPSVLALIATSWFISEIAQILGERRWYVNAGLWFGVVLGTMTYADVAQMEIHLCLFYAASWWAGLKFLNTQPEEERNYRWLYGAFLIAGLSALVKSPLYSVFWVSSFFIYLLISGEWLMFKNKHLYLACLSGIGLGVLWFAAVYLREPDIFWNQYWLQEQAGKSGGNGGTVFGLWTALLYMAFPSTLLVFTAARSVWIGRRTNAVFRWVVAWSIPPALFFTFYPYRISPYLFILMPAIAVLVDWGCFRSNRTRTFQWVSRATGILMAIALPILALTLFRLDLAPMELVLAVAFSGIACLVTAWNGWMRAFLAAAFCVVLLVRIGVAEISERDLDGLRTAAAGEIQSHRIAMLDEDHDVWHEVGILGAGLSVEMKRLDGLDGAIEHLSHLGVLVLTDLQVEKYSQTLATVMKERGIELQTAEWQRFKRRQKLPMKDLILKGREGVPDFNERMTRVYSVIRAKRLGSN